MPSEPDWEPPPGTTKRQCLGCQKWFASRGTAQCPDCLAGRPAKRRKRASDGPFDGYSLGRMLGNGGQGRDDRR